jgi:group I intron endonuclease
LIIYKVTNLINGKIYIGKTVRSLARRKRAHFASAFNRGYRSRFHAAIKKYGKENFKWEIIDRCLFVETLSELESHYIKLFNCMAPHGMNLTAGGEGVVGMRHSAETRERIAAAMRGRKVSDETRARCSVAQCNKSPETRAKLSAAHKGKVLSAETRIKLSIINTGKHLSDETKMKISRKHKNRYFSPEHRRKISLAKIGHEVTPEVREKLSISNRKRFSDPEERKRMSVAKTNPSIETRKKISEAALAAWAKRKSTVAPAAQGEYGEICPVGRRSALDGQSVRFAIKSPPWACYRPPLASGKEYRHLLPCLGNFISTSWPVDTQT